MIGYVDDLAAFKLFGSISLNSFNQILFKNIDTSGCGSG